LPDQPLNIIQAQLWDRSRETRIQPLAVSGSPTWIRAIERGYLRHLRFVVLPLADISLPLIELQFNSFAVRKPV